MPRQLPVGTLVWVASALTIACEEASRLGGTRRALARPVNCRVVRRDVAFVAARLAGPTGTSGAEPDVLSAVSYRSVRLW